MTASEQHLGLQALAGLRALAHEIETMSNQDAWHALSDLLEDLGLLDESGATGPAAIELRVIWTRSGATDQVGLAGRGGFELYEVDPEDDREIGDQLWDDIKHAAKVALGSGGGAS